MKILKESESITSAFLDYNIPIIFESSDAFAPYLSVALLSFKQHISQEIKYDIIILSCDISNHNENKIKKIFFDTKNISIRFFIVKNIVDKYINNAKFKYFELCFCRLLLPWIFPNFKKIINLGADIIIEKDISKLYEQQIPHGYYLSGVEDIGYQGRLGRDIPFEDLSLKYPFKYVNADVLIYDLEKIRNDFTENDIMSVWQKKFLQCAEQDALNLIFDGKIYLLDLRWNIFNKRSETEEYINNAPSESKKKYEDAYKKPYIIHYAGNPKPWNFPDVGYAEKWWSYARTSEYYELILHNMCQGICNNKTKKILNILIPKDSFLRHFCKKCFPMGSMRYVYCKRILKYLSLVK